MYEYRVTGVNRIIDGDTYDLTLDLGFFISTQVRIVLSGIDTYEMFGKNAHPLGVEARNFAAGWFQTQFDRGNDIFVATQPAGRGDAGRYAHWFGSIVALENESDTVHDLADALHRAELGKPAGTPKT